MNTRLINEYFTGNSAKGYALGVKTDTISNLVPKTYRQAMKSAESAQWQEAIDAELQSMHTNDAWTPDILPIGRKLVTAKWVFRPKHDIHGKISKYKAMESTLTEHILQLLAFLEFDFFVHFPRGSILTFNKWT